MYRMLIVEDEEIEREGLRDLIDWPSMDIRVAGAVESGEEALAFVRSSPIDILFTDIKLNGISGLELSRELLAVNPDLKVIISSGFQDFEYAKTAVALSAYGYLSKPIQLDELTQVVHKVLNTCGKERSERMEKDKLKKLVAQNMPLLQNRFLMGLVQGSLSEQEIQEHLEYFGMDLHVGPYTIFLTDLDQYELQSKDQSREEKELFIAEITETLQAHSAPHISFHMQGTRFCTIFQAEMGDSPKETLEDFAAKLHKAVYTGCGQEATVGIGSTVSTLIGLKHTCKAAWDAVRNKIHLGGNQIIHYYDIRDVPNGAAGLETEEIEKRILSAIELCDGPSLDQGIELLFQVMAGQSTLADAYARNICITLLAKAAVLLLDRHESLDKIFGKENTLWDKLLRFDSLYDLKLYMHSTLHKILNHLSRRKERSNKRIIGQILSIIERDYGKNLTISDVAEEVYLSANYTGILFKKEMGQTFSDYLVRFRLEKAAQLLRGTHLKVYHIGSMVGYNNISYFCSAFKSAYGVTPSEYRERL